MNIIERMFGTHSERELKLIYPLVDKIESPVSYTHLTLPTTSRV